MASSRHNFSMDPLTTYIDDRRSISMERGALGSFRLPTTTDARRFRSSEALDGNHNPSPSFAMVLLRPTILGTGLSSIDSLS